MDAWYPACLRRRQKDYLTIHACFQPNIESMDKTDAKNLLRPPKLDSKIGVHFTVALRGREKFILNLSSHESSTSEGTAHEEKPNGAPSKHWLKGTNGKEADRCSDGPASVDEASDSSKGLVISTDRWVGSKISSNSRSDDVVGTV